MTVAEQTYRERFEHLLLGYGPESVLDVGCGTGELLRRLGGKVMRAAGVDNDEKHVTQARGEGLAVSRNPAETLPFEDGEFDFVVSQYTAHHLAEAAAGTHEMLRVARRGVMVLDIWYDLSIPAQAVSHQLDLWSKRIDEDDGEIHRPLPSAAQILGPIGDDRSVRVGIEHWLVNEIDPPEPIVEFAARQLRRSRHPERDGKQWREIERRARGCGFGVDGAIVVTLLKT